MDKYYGNVCELDIIFNFQKAYFILDELLIAGELQESSKKNVLRCISQEDALEDMEVCSTPPLFFTIALSSPPPLHYLHLILFIRPLVLPTHPVYDQVFMVNSCLEH